MIYLLVKLYGEVSFIACINKIKGCVHYIVASLLCISKKERLQIKKKCFYSTSKALFVLEIIKF